MKRITFLKSLLLAALLSVGASAWAATTWNFTDTSIWGSATSKANNSLYKGGDSEVYYTANGVVADASTSNVSFLFTSEVPRFNYGGVSGFQFGTNGSTTANRIKVNVPTGATATITVQRASNSRPIAIHDGTKVIQTLTSATSYAYTNNSEVSAATLYIYASSNGALQQQSIASISIAETFTITTHYYYNDGEKDVSIVADNVTAVESGSSYTLPYTETIQSGDYTYTYSSGAQTIASVSVSAEYAIYYTRAERKKYSVSVMAKYGENTVEILQSAEYSEGEIVKYYAPAYYLDGTTLYAFPEDDGDDNTSDGITWGGSYTVTAAKDIVLDYVAQDGEFVTYIEGEALSGATAQQDYFKDLMSNGTGGVISSESPAKVATLPAGIYKLTIRSIGRSSDNNNARTCSVIVGDKTTSWTQDTNGSINTLDIVLTENTDIKAFGGYKTTSQNAWNLDFIYIQKTGDVASATIGAYGYATFSSTYALDFTNVTEATALIATEKSGDNIKLQAVTGTVAAGTGLILKSANGGSTTVSIPVAASGTLYDTASNPKNYLFAINSDYNLKASNDGTNYVLSVQDGKVVFAPIAETAAPVTAGHAALWLPATATGARVLNLSFSDEDTTTGIEAVESAKQHNATYNLSGQRVAQPTKGLYIVGGKKVFVK